jgi:signal transduction histidine kinase/FixJ family two-component response regulator
MKAPQERILVVESDISVTDLIVRQTLMPLGFQVQITNNAADAIQDAARFVPDVIIMNLNLPGLSGKDVLAALSAQGLEMPVIVIAEKGMEGDVIQAFRLGAADFLSWPLREAEIVTAVERVLRQVRARRERESLSRQLNQTNQELQRRVRELTTIFSIGKAVTSITDKRALMDKIIEGAVLVAEADVGWMLLLEERTRQFILSAHRNLPKAMAAYTNLPWDDGLSSLVSLSGEPLAIHGEPLKRFRVAALGQSALVVPVKVKNEVVGLLTVVRKAAQPMGAKSQALVEALADYASIAIVNAHLFRALEDRALTSQAAADTVNLDERIVDELMRHSGEELSHVLQSLRNLLERLSATATGKLNPEQSKTLLALRERVKIIADIADAMSVMGLEDSANNSDGNEIDCNELARQSTRRFQHLAQQAGVALSTELSSSPVFVSSQPFLVAKVLDAYLSNAIRVTPKGGQVVLRVERTADQRVHVSVEDKGPGMDESQLANIFAQIRQPLPPTAGWRFAGLAISLVLVKRIITALNGRAWAESKPGQGTTFHFSLPAR